VKVEDNYQWLEQDDDPAVKAWSDAAEAADARVPGQVAGPCRDRDNS